MRHGQAGKRPRGRNGRRPHNNSRVQVYDSNGPNVRIRGNALQVYEKYQQLARDSSSRDSSSGDRISTESLLQHAEHYFRLHTAQVGSGGDNRPPQSAPRPSTPNGDGETGSQQSNGQDTGAEPERTQP